MRHNVEKDMEWALKDRLTVLDRWTVHVERAVVHGSEQGEFPKVYREQVITANGVVVTPEHVFTFDLVISASYTPNRGLRETHSVAISDTRGLMTRCASDYTFYDGFHPSAVEHDVEDPTMVNDFVNVLSGHTYNFGRSALDTAATVLRYLVRG